MKRLMVSKGCLGSENLSCFRSQLPHSRGRKLPFQGCCEHHAMSRRSPLDGNHRNSAPSLPCLLPGDAGRRATATFELLEGVKGNQCLFFRQIVLRLGCRSWGPRPPPYQVDLKPDPLTVLVSDMNPQDACQGVLTMLGLGTEPGRGGGKGRLYIPVKNLGSRMKQT